MNYFEAIFAECFDITWTDAHEQVDTMTVYDDGQVMLLSETNDGNVLVGKTCIDNIFFLPDAIIEALTTVGKVTCKDTGEISKLNNVLNKIG